LASAAPQDEVTNGTAGTLVPSTTVPAQASVLTTAAPPMIRTRRLTMSTSLT